MAKFDKCEHCQKPRLDGELLSTVDCWVIATLDGKRRPSYWYVCSACNETRQQWCENVFPDICERCGGEIGEGEHRFEGYDDREVAQGVDPEEKIRVICEACSLLPVARD